MKILFLANKDLASNFALNQILPQVSKNHDTHLWLSAKVGNNSTLPKQLATLKFFEQDLFNQLISPLLPSTQSANSYKNFAHLGDYLNTAPIEVNQINSPDNVERLKGLSPDLIVSIRYGGILKAPVINIPSKGVINLHSGLLPKYKGVMATFWALKNNDTEIGTTLHTIEDSSIDTGQIITISKQQSRPNKSYLWHVLELYLQGALDILNAIDTLTNSKVLKVRPQSESNTYFTFPNEAECLQFEKNGYKLVDEQDYLAFINSHYL